MSETKNELRTKLREVEKELASTKKELAETKGALDSLAEQNLKGQRIAAVILFRNQVSVKILKVPLGDGRTPLRMEPG